MLQFKVENAEIVYIPLSACSPMSLSNYGFLALVYIKIGDDRNSIVLEKNTEEINLNTDSRYGNNIQIVHIFAFIVADNEIVNHTLTETVNWLHLVGELVAKNVANFSTPRNISSNVSIFTRQVQPVSNL